MKKQIRQYFPLALLAFLVYLAVHYWAGIEKLAGVFFSAVTPLLAGCFIAYAVNILMSWFERQYSRLFRSERALRFRRGICILLAFLTLLAIITAAMGIMIPRLTGSLGHIVTRLGILLEQLAAFLDGRIPFGRIPEILRDALDRVPQRSVNCIADVYQTDADARACAREFIRRNS